MAVQVPVPGPGGALTSVFSYAGQLLLGGFTSTFTGLLTQQQHLSNLYDRAGPNAEVQLSLTSIIMLFALVFIVRTAQSTMLCASASSEQNCLMRLQSCEK